MKLRSALFIASLFGISSILSPFIRYQLGEYIPTLVSARTVFADDDRDDEEDEGDKEDEENSENKSSVKSSRTLTTKESVITTYRLVEKTVTFLDEKFKIDTDGDLLVDGLDPHPTIPEPAFFTDDDEDAVPNALDKYPDEDDFFLFQDEDDQDKDGILDAFSSVFLR